MVAEKLNGSKGLRLSESVLQNSQFSMLAQLPTAEKDIEIPTIKN